MSNQAEHPALLIPGPIEFDDAVLGSMAHFRFVLPTHEPRLRMLTTWKPESCRRPFRRYIR